MSRAPCFSRATARMARPRSVPRISHSRQAATASAPPNAISRQRDQRRPDLDRRQRIGRVDAARIGLEPDQREVLQHDGQSQRDQQDVLVLAMAGAVDHQPLQQVAQREHARHHQRQRRVGIQPQPLVEQIDRVQRHHQRRAMGEVDDVQHAVDQGQAQRHQRVHGAGGQAVEHGAEEDGGIQRHRVRPSRGTARPPAGTRAG